MIAVRDILVFAGLVMVAVVFIASLFPAREGVSPVPQCSDCAFKLIGPYVLVQYGNYAAVQLGERQLARYGWAYVDGKPLRPGDAASCYPDPMYLWVVGGVAYASCRGEPRIGSSYSVNYTAPAVTVVVKDQDKAGWSVEWSGSASGSRSGVGDASWQILTAVPITLRASSKCRVEPPSATARPGDAVVFAVSCSKYLRLDITYYMGLPFYCRNNVHAAWGSASADFCSSSSPGYAALWIDLATGQRVQEPSGVACSPTTPISVEKYSTGNVAYLNVEEAGNEVSFRGDGYVAQYGFSAIVGNLRLTVYVLDTWTTDWGQGADVYFYLCK